MPRDFPAPFDSPYAHDLVRVAGCVPRIEPACPAYNADRTLELLSQGHDDRVALMVFPELGLSAYAIDDLHQQDALLEAVEEELARLVEASRELFPCFAVGLPRRVDGRLFNLAVVIHSGQILGAVPKTFLPNYREFYERRWFASGAGVVDREIALAGQTAPFGVDLLFRSAGTAPFTFGVEICEDVWVPNPPSTAQALAGAEILLNLSASNITIAKADARRLLCAAQSSRCNAAYIYSAAGPGESTTDLAWDGHASIFERGRLIAETARFNRDSVMTVADIDVGMLRQERSRTGSMWDAQALPTPERQWRYAKFTLDAPRETLPLKRPLERYPFVPSDPAQLAVNCEEAYQIQVQGLAERLKAVGYDKLVIGVSGGLDSTQALIVCRRVMDDLGLPRANILGFTMPGFGTSNASKARAWDLMSALGVTAEELDIRPAAQQMLTDMDHPFSRGEPVYDLTFENVQAGLRTDYLFRLANRHRAIVVGTGDLSELGLGWMTYGVGDHMSHYNPNAGVSKTLMQHLIRYLADSPHTDDAAAAVLRDIVDAEISPELIPSDGGGAVQSTEAAVGPYALQDFNLYWLTRFGLRPSKIAYLSWKAWGDARSGAWPANTPSQARVAYDLPTVKHWLALFLRRFFANQFKRSAMPNGPKISSGGALSPRGDWRMPSDATASAWLKDLDRVHDQG